MSGSVYPLRLSLYFFCNSEVLICNFFLSLLLRILKVNHKAGAKAIETNENPSEELLRWRIKPREVVNEKPKH